MTGPVPGSKPVLALLMRLLWGVLLVLPSFAAHAGVVFTTLHSFQILTNGENPQAGLVQGSDGNFYGTTYRGGTNGGGGTVFKISTNGALTSLYSFTGGNDGASPQAGLVLGSDDNFYGTTQSGGTNGWGTVFKISANGALTSLYSFTGSNDGANPQSGLVEGSDGNFYGTTSSGGTKPFYGGYGTVFKINTNGMLTRLYSFTGGSAGANPNGLAQGSDGDFYGTTVSGGTGLRGTVFKISSNGVPTILHSFAGGNDGANPGGGLVQGSDGNFYGTTEFGGTSNSGTVFKISANGAYNNLYSFTGGNEGAQPYATLVQGGDGNFYGTTGYGGVSIDNNFLGTVFKISTNGALTTLHAFTSFADGSNPNGLVQGADGNFYGTTLSGGTGGVQGGIGSVFKITTNGMLTSLYSFPGATGGASPYSALVQGSDGNLYGTTLYGGANGDGIVFKISTNGALMSLYDFGTVTNATGYPLDGAAPRAGLVQDSDGNLYGTTAGGGTNNGGGTVFKITTNGMLTSLYSFSFTNDGAQPYDALVQGSDGNFYGTTEYGGRHGYGTVFKITTNGTLTSLYSFTGGNDGESPQAGLVQGSNGNFYGTTPFGGGASGTVFKISTNNVLTTLHTFTTDGQTPLAGLVQGSDGYFYGTTLSGPMVGNSGGDGIVFKISAAGALTHLHSFTGADGNGPEGALVQGRDGNFYGTTLNGGMYGAVVAGYGTVFKMSTNGTLTSLYSFTSGSATGGPQAGLVQGSDGSFYGTTVGGGLGGSGTVFRLTIVPEPPELTIIPSDANVILTWPSDAPGFTLESTLSLGAAAVWNPVSPLPVVVNGQNTVTNPITGTARYYRLALLP